MDVHPTKNGINRYWPIPIYQNETSVRAQDTYAHTTQDAIVFVKNGPELVAGESGFRPAGRERQEHELHIHSRLWRRQPGASGSTWLDMPKKGMSVSSESEKTAAYCVGSEVTTGSLAFWSGRRPLRQTISLAGVWFVVKCHSCTWPDFKNAKCDQIFLDFSTLHVTAQVLFRIDLVLPAVGSPTGSLPDSSVLIMGGYVCSYHPVNKQGLLQNSPFSLTILP